MQTTIRIPAPIACLKVNNEVKFVGSWAIATSKKKTLLKNGTQLHAIELHKAPHLDGIDYCSKCGIGTKNPYIFKYENTYYWKCECMKINFLNSKI